MVRLLKQIISNEKGQALPLVLALLVLGGLTIAPSLSYANTSLNSSRMLEEGVNGLYAADAGVENTLWCMENGIPPPQQLSDNINQMEVAIQTEEKGIYTLYLGELILPGEHYDYLDVDGEMVWDGEAEAYEYTITVTWQPNEGMPVIHLEGVGARLPIGYSYQLGSAASFVGNISTDEPDETLDGIGAYLLHWELDPPLSFVSENNTVQTQAFYINGEGSQEGDYAWVLANREDVGAVSEITGTSYKITATATRPVDDRTTAKIVADTIRGEMTYIVSWQVLR